MKSRASIIRVAGFIALAGNLCLALTKLILGEIAGSLAVVGDGVDSCTDVGIALMTVLISRIIEQPGDAEHPWGHGRAETTGTMVLSFIIFVAGLELFKSSILQLVYRDFSIDDVSNVAFIACIISIVGKTALASSQFYFAKKCDSMMLSANAQNMKNDIVTSSCVLLGIIAAKYFSMPIFDPIVAVCVSLWIMKNAFGMFWSTNKELMDGGADKELYKKLFDAVMSVKGVSNPHKARIRRLASRWDIDIDIEVAGNMTVRAAHNISNKVEESIRRAMPDIYDIVIHIEPSSHLTHPEKEQFGLSQSDLMTN